MTTPQTTLYRLESRVSYLCNLLEANEDHESISERMKRVEIDIGDLMSAQQRMESLLNHIVKILGHKE
jgi:hypothetical protein